MYGRFWDQNMERGKQIKYIGLAGKLITGYLSFASRNKKIFFSHYIQLKALLLFNLGLLWQSTGARGLRFATVSLGRLILKIDLELDLGSKVSPFISTINIIVRVHECDPLCGSPFSQSTMYYQLAHREMILERTRLLCLGNSHNLRLVCLHIIRD
jgi:hypothetical protein